MFNDTIMFSFTGDVVIFGNTIATVFIEPNDDPNGVFSFLPPTMQVMETEGAAVTFQ